MHKFLLAAALAAGVMVWNVPARAEDKPADKPATEKPVEGDKKAEGEKPGDGAEKAADKEKPADGGEKTEKPADKPAQSK